MGRPITFLSDYCLHILRNASLGAVHSVYRKTVNLSVGGSLLALQAKNSPISPISLITDLPLGISDVISCRPGQKVFISPNTLTLMSDQPSGEDTVSFDFGQSRHEDLRLSQSLSGPQVSLLSQNIRTAIHLSASSGFQPLFQTFQESGHLFSRQEDPVLQLAARRLKAASAYILSSAWLDAALELRGLIGLGIGLTPSGDDFLCGFLAGLILSGLKDHPLAHALREEIYFHLKDTNDISAAFLACALEGQFSLPVKELAGLPSPGHILETFGSIGHSSGFDTLCGIFNAFYTKGLIQTISPSSPE